MRETTITRTVFYPGEGYKLEVHAVTPEALREFLRTIDTRAGVCYPASRKAERNGDER
jgi:hypothetical protein